MELFKGIIEAKTLKVLSLFLKNPNELYHINKASLDSGVPLATAFRVINKLTENSFLEYRQISKFRIYKLADNKKTRKLRKLL